VKAEFYRPEAPVEIVGWARWPDVEDSSSAASPAGRESLERIFRRSPIVVDDPSLRTFGTAGPAVLQPGSLRWFQAAARIRSSAEGLAVRFVAEEDDAMGWDPAGAYRAFPDAMERRVRIAAHASP
jgi:hypothetical protein